MKRELMLFTLLILIISPLSRADLDSQMACSTDTDCISCENRYQNQYRCYCYSSTSTCWINTSSAGQIPPTNQQLDESIEAVAPGNTTSELDTQPPTAAALPVSASEIMNQQQLAVLQSSLVSLQQQISQLGLQLQSVSAQEGQVGALRSQLSSMASGFAALQQNLETTKSELNSIDNRLKSEQKKTKLLSGLVYSLVILILAAALVYFISSFVNNRKRQVNPQVLRYITNHLKKGASYNEIKTNLQTAGWSLEDIEWAYQATLRHYRKAEKIGGLKFDKNKIAGISVVSILIIISLIFLLKGITTGQAIRFETEEELSKNIRQVLQTRIITNQFYSLVQSATLCLEVKDGLKTVSYRIVKTAAGHSFDPAPKPCSEDVNYHAAIKFTSWNSFEHLMNDFTCRTARELHLESNGIRGIYVLPSQLVLPGFKKNSKIDYKPFCPLLRDCLTTTEQAVLGCD